MPRLLLARRVYPACAGIHLHRLADIVLAESTPHARIHPILPRFLDLCWFYACAGIHRFCF